MDRRITPQGVYVLASGLLQSVRRAHRSCMPSRVPAALQTACAHLSSRVAATSVLFGDLHGSWPARHHSPFHRQSEPLVTFKWSGGQNMGNLLINVWDCCFFPKGSSLLGWERKVLLDTQETASTKQLEIKALLLFHPTLLPHRAWLRVSEFGEWLGSPLTPRSGYFLCYLIPTGKILGWRE